MASDPFAQNEGNEFDAEDPFGQPAGGGNYPKAEELNGCLIMLTPVKVEEVQKYRGKPGEMSERLSADTFVIDGERAGEEFDSMYWSQLPIVNAAKSAQRKGVKAILGRLRRFPISEDVKNGKFERGDWEAIEAAIAKGGKNVPQFAWVLDKYTEDDAKAAREALKARK